MVDVEEFVNQAHKKRRKGLAFMLLSKQPPLAIALSPSMVASLVNSLMFPLTARYFGDLPRFFAPCSNGADNLRRERD